VAHETTREKLDWLREQRDGAAHAGTEAATAPLDRLAASRTRAADRLDGTADCQPAPLARNPAG